jgi:hypothetical protein
MTRNREHIELGFIDIPMEYNKFTEEKKIIIINKIIDTLLLHIDRDLDPMYNRIDFLNEVLDSSIMTNEEEEQYEICSVLLDCKKQLNFE